MNSNNAFAIQIEAAAEKRRHGPHAKPSHLRLIRPDDDDSTVLVLQKSWIVEPEPEPIPEPPRPAPAAVVSEPDYEPFLVRVGDAVIRTLSHMLDAVVRQLGFLLIITAIVGMTSIGHWVGFNQRVALDVIANVSAIMAAPLEPKIVAHDWDEVTGERVGGCDSPQTTKAGCRPYR